MEIRSMKLLLLVGATAILSSCGKEKKDPPPAIRSIKTITLSKRATGQLRQFSGIIYSTNSSKLSFEDVSGRVTEVKVDIGDKVKRGDTLAVLDKEKYALDVKNSQADLEKAQASLVKAESDFNRAKKLYKKQVISQKEFETRTYQLAAAKSELLAIKADLGQAERNLKNTVLRAPFDGSIGARMIEPQQGVVPGQKIFRLDANGPIEIRFDIPESLMKRVSLGDEGVVTFPGQPNLQARSKITFLGSAATKGNAFPVKAQLLEIPPEIKPGMTAEISMTLKVKETDSGFLIPPSAILYSNKKKTGFVFLYDPATSTIKKTEVHFKGAQGDLGIVTGGNLKTGDIIAVAGVSFLFDGMKVNLMKGE